MKNDMSPAVYPNMSGLSGIEFYSSPTDLYSGRRVRNGYLPPKPDWDDEKKKAWNKYQAMLGRYPGLSFSGNISWNTHLISLCSKVCLTQENMSLPFNSYTN